MAIILGNILAAALVLGVLIIVHEFGHFAASKALGIEVQVFSIGFGPRLFGLRRKGTDYRLSALPFGGYVKMLGENPYEPLEGRKEEFLSRSKKDQFIVLIMGVTLNILLAIVLMTVVFWVGVETPAYLEEKPIIGWVAPESPAVESDIRPGDLVLSINNRKISTWEELQMVINTSGNQELLLSLERNGEIITRSLTPQALPPRDIGYAGLIEPIPPRIHQVEEGFPADLAELKEGDMVVEIDAEPVNHFYQLYSIIQEKGEQELTFVVFRQGELLRKSIIPRKDGEIYRIGIANPSETVVKRYGPVDALRESLVRNSKMTLLTFEVIEKLVTRELSLRSASGPIEIARFSGAAARRGLIPLLQLIAIISLQLGIINLLPIPVLDGGHLFTLLIEGIIRRNLSLKVKERLMQVGFAILIAIMGMVIYYDIVKNL